MFFRNGLVAQRGDSNQPIEPPLIERGVIMLLFATSHHDLKQDGVGSRRAGIILGGSGQALTT